MKNIRKVFLLVFIMTMINSTVYGQEEIIGEDVYSLAEGPYPQVSESDLNAIPMEAPKPIEVEDLVDSGDIVEYDFSSGIETILPVESLKKESSSSNITPEYKGLMEDGLVPESIIGTDSRSRVYSTSTFPWRTVVSIVMTFPNGGTYICSGAMVDDYHVLTAGHCIYNGPAGDDNFGGWATSVKIMPGRDGSNLPYNYAWATKLRTYTSWTSNEDHRYDMALLTLDRNVGKYTGWMGRMWRTVVWPFYIDPVYTGGLNTAGYPGDKPSGEMWFDYDQGRTADANNHWYYMDTVGGQSGSPVWLLESGNRYILTVHAYGNDGSGSNHGTRLNEDKYNDINSWRFLEPAPTDKADLTDDGQSYSGFSPTTVKQGDSLHMWSDVRNIGTASSGGFYVSYYASTNNIISTTDYLIGTDYVSSITPFTKSDSDLTQSFPSNIPAGSYYVGWIIDSSNLVSEFSESNNNAYKSAYQLTVKDPLFVSISENPDPVLEAGKSKVTIRVTTKGSVAVSNAYVSLSTTGGSLESTYGYTNSAGYLYTNYTAPSVDVTSIYTISATASKTGYASDSGSDTITVNPLVVLPRMGVSISETPDPVKSGGRSEVTVRVTTLTIPIQPISDANVALSTTGGTLVPLTGVTNATGYLTSNYTAPTVTETTDFTISAKASKKGFISESNSNNITVVPLILPVLSVYISEYPDPVISGEKSKVTVRVLSGKLPVMNAYVSLSATGGSLNPITGYTDALGILTSEYSAPFVKVESTFNITATASKKGYINGEDVDPITVIPLKGMKVEVTEVPDPVISGGASDVNVTVTSGGLPVSGAAVSVSSSGGAVNPVMGVTDLSGNFTTEYSAPLVAAPTVYLINATASKTGYITAIGSDTITVIPMIVEEPLFVTITEVPDPVISGGISKVKVHVTTSNGAPVNEAYVRVFTKNGTLEPLNGTTDATGDFYSEYYAPKVDITSKFEILAMASKKGYQSAKGSDAITVYPDQLNRLVVVVSEIPDPVLSGEISKVTAHVTTPDGSPVSNARVEVSATGGTLSPINGTTDINGDFKSDYKAIVSMPATFEIKAFASKSGYASAVDYDTINVTVKRVPDINVTPSSLSFVLPPGGVGIETLGIENTGGANLIYSITDTESWLDEDPASGTLIPGSNDIISVKVIAPMTPGGYGANIIISSNDPDENPVTVPVKLYVREISGPRVYVSPDYTVASAGSKVAVDIMVDPNGVEVYGAEYKLYFDTSKLEAQSQTNGTFLIQDGNSSINIVNNIDNTLGILEYGEFRMDTDVGVTTPGVLAKLEFRIKDPAPEGETILNLTEVVLSDPSPAEIPGVSVIDGIINISSNQPPVADCGPDKLRCENVDAPVQFNGSASFDPDGTIVQYYWDFGDGMTDTVVNPKHVYSSYKWDAINKKYLPFDVTLTVTDNNGATDTDTQLVTIWIKGDSNGDGKVNIIDASVVGLNWGSNDPCGDLNNDGKVNIIDASIIGLNWGKIA